MITMMLGVDENRKQLAEVAAEFLKQIGVKEIAVLNRNGSVGTYTAMHFATMILTRIVEQLES